MIDKIKTLFAAAKAKLAALYCKLVGHKRPEPRRWDEVPSRTFTCDRCGAPDQKLW